MIEEVLPLVREDWRDTAEVLLRRMSDYDSRCFSTQLIMDLAVKSGQPLNNEIVDEINTCASAIEKRLKVSEKL